MSRLPVISGAVCIKVLAKIGFVIDRQRGSHVILVREDPLMTVCVPDHQELDRGTLRAIIRQVGLSVDEFVDLLWDRSNLNNDRSNHKIDRTSLQTRSNIDINRLDSINFKTAHIHHVRRFKSHNSHHLLLMLMRGIHH